MPLDGELQLLGRHADPVIDHRDERPAALLQSDGDAMRAGIDGILDQLLHGTRRPFDDLAGRDAVDQRGGQSAQNLVGRAHGVRSLRLPPLGKILAGEDLGFLDGGLV